MMGLWTDGWFYISSAGLAVSGVLFFFLLGQYRAASEAADAGEPEKEAETHAPIRPVYIPDEPAAASVASHAEPKAEPKSEAKTADYAGPERRKDPATSTGGISPAVVYLQNIKGELANLHEDVRKLAKKVDDELASVATRDEALIERLAELTRAVEAAKAAVPAPAAEPAAPKKEKAPKKEPAAAPPAPKSEPAPVAAPAAVVEDLAGLVAPAPAPEPKVELKAPEPAPKTEAVSPDATIRLELGSSMGVPKDSAAQTPAESAPAAEAPAPEEKPRRGPVWPV